MHASLRELQPSMTLLGLQPLLQAHLEHSVDADTFMTLQELYSMQVDALALVRCTCHHGDTVLPLSRPILQHGLQTTAPWPVILGAKYADKCYKRCSDLDVIIMQADPSAALPAPPAPQQPAASPAPSPWGLPQQQYRELLQPKHLPCPDAEVCEGI